MNTSPFITTTLGFVLVFLIFMISRSISQKAASLLSDEQKIKLNEEFASMRKYDLVPFAAIFTIYAIGIYFFKSYVNYFTTFLVVSIVIYFIVSHQMIFDKFKKLELPEEYVKQILFSRMIIYAGLALLAAVVLISKY